MQGWDGVELSDVLVLGPRATSPDDAVQGANDDMFQGSSADAEDVFGQLTKGVNDWHWDPAGGDASVYDGDDEGSDAMGHDHDLGQGVLDLYLISDHQDLGPHTGEAHTMGSALNDDAVQAFNHGPLAQIKPDINFSLKPGAGKKAKVLPSTRLGIRSTDISQGTYFIQLVMTSADPFFNYATHVIKASRNTVPYHFLACAGVVSSTTFLSSGSGDPCHTFLVPSAVAALAAAPQCCCIV